MQIGTANAKPTKAFFVRMLTRDISLEDCILDLVDNSVDAAWKTSGDTPSGLLESLSLAAFQVDILIGESEFSIVDNCGGLTFDEAVNTAFSFGRSDVDWERWDESDELAEETESVEKAAPEPSENGQDGASSYMVGVYGIGMKRSIFKLGKVIDIFSTYEEADGSIGSFVVPIRVRDWLGGDRPDWDFDIDDAPPQDQPGVGIYVKDLNALAIERFRDASFVSGLRRMMERDYPIPLMRGLNLLINGQRVEPSMPNFRVGADFAPMRETYDDDGVRVEIIAGMIAPPPEDDDPEEQSNRNASLYRRSGWYIACNGRVILAEDRTSNTVWGNGTIPRWHPQYLGFMGFAFFSALNSKLLPMTTTKRSVDPTSDVYRRALVRMAVATRDWIDYTNERKADLAAAQQRESEATGLRLAQVEPRARMSLPTVRRGPTSASVQYSVPIDRMRNLADAMGDINLSFREVGRRAFDYTYDHMVGEDE